MFYVFFMFMFVFATWCIWRRWARYTYYSAGYYKDGGQDITVWCPKTKDEIIDALVQKSSKDTLNYKFSAEDNICYLTIYGVNRWQKYSLFKSVFRVDFFERDNGTYIVAKRTQIIYSYAFEAELYEFFVKKLNCVAKENVK